MLPSISIGPRIELRPAETTYKAGRGTIGSICGSGDDNVAPLAIEATTKKERRTIILSEDVILAMERARRSELKISASGTNMTQMVRKKEGSISSVNWEGLERRLQRIYILQ